MQRADGPARLAPLIQLLGLCAGIARINPGPGPDFGFQRFYPGQAGLDQIDRPKRARGKAVAQRDRPKPQHRRRFIVVGHRRHPAG